MIMINCGCGSKFHRDWINIDFASSYKEVQIHNLLNGLPFEDKFADFIYNSHFLEHLNREQVTVFLKECYRVLKIEGYIRIVIPDLENVTKEYLSILQQIKLEPDNKELSDKYNFICLELLDQMVRQEPGGELGKYYKRNGSSEYIKQRVGYIRDRVRMPNKSQKEYGNLIILKNKIYNYLVKNYKWFKVYDIGKFNLRGEKHLWMYDKYSISLLLHNCGFKNIQFFHYNESSLKSFDKYKLEINSQKEEYKPNSIYVEAQKIMN